MAKTTPDIKEYYDDEQLQLSLSEKEVAILFVLLDYYYEGGPPDFPPSLIDKDTIHHLGSEQDTYDNLMTKLVNHAPVFSYWDAHFAGYQSVENRVKPCFPEDPKLRTWYEAGIDTAYLSSSEGLL